MAAELDPQREYPCCPPPEAGAEGTPAAAAAMILLEGAETDLWVRCVVSLVGVPNMWGGGVAGGGPAPAAAAAAG
jgi:hypothetical protein